METPLRTGEACRRRPPLRLGMRQIPNGSATIGNDPRS
jgi:hypothetical protein